MTLSTSGSQWETRSARAPREDGSGGRVPPSAIDAEKAVLSAIMLDNEVLQAVIDQIRAEDFYHPAHQILFQTMIDLNNTNRPVDLTVLAAELGDTQQLEAVGGLETLVLLSQYEATSANAEHYAGIIRDKAVKRNLIHVASEIVAQGFDPAEPADQLLDAAESKIFELSQAKAKTTLKPLKDRELLDDAVTHIEHLMNREGDLTGVATGFKDFDALTGGLQPGDLMILAARPSMGKTALALNMARNAALNPDRPCNVAFFSLEMTTRSLIMRMLSSEAEVDFATFHKGFISFHAHSRIAEAAGRLHDAGLWIDDTGGATVLEMRAKSRRLKARNGLDLVVVDYLQLAHGDGRTDSREQEISQISRGLKGLAKELNIPVIALSQLNRGPESRGAEDKRPMLADLRESGAIEQDADVIAFIYRDFVYNKETEYEDLAELIVAKQRNGPTDTVRLRFEGRFARFKDWQQADYAGAVPQHGASFDSDGPTGMPPGIGGAFDDPDF